MKPSRTEELLAIVQLCILFNPKSKLNKNIALDYFNHMINKRK